MALKDKLDAQRAASAARLGPEKLAIMKRATDALRDPAIMGRAVCIGQPAPAFSLPNHDGAAVASPALLARGPLVLSFFRGQW